MAYVVERRKAVQYDGTNGAYICGEWSNGGVTLLSDDGETLRVQATEQPEFQATVPVGNWLVALLPYIVQSLTPEQYAITWLELSDPRP